MFTQKNIDIIQLKHSACGHFLPLNFPISGTKPFPPNACPYITFKFIINLYNTVSEIVPGNQVQFYFFVVGRFVHFNNNKVNFSEMVQVFIDFGIFPDLKI